MTPTIFLKLLRPIGKTSSSSKLIPDCPVEFVPERLRTRYSLGTATLSPTQPPNPLTFLWTERAHYWAVARVVQPSEASPVARHRGMESARYGNRLLSFERGWEVFIEQGQKWLLHFETFLIRDKEAVKVEVVTWEKNIYIHPWNYFLCVVWTTETDRCKKNPYWAESGGHQVGWKQVSKRKNKQAR